MFKLLLILLFLIQPAHAVTTTTYNGYFADATWDKTDSDPSAVRYGDSDNVDDTLANSIVEFSYDSGTNKYIIQRSVAVWDLTSIPAGSVYIVNAKVKLNSDAFSPTPVDSATVGITQSFISKFSDTRKQSEFPLTRNQDSDPDTFTEIADRKTITSKNNATFTLYQNQLGIISLENEQGLQVGIHHGYDLDQKTPSGINKMYFMSGDAVTAANRPNLLLTTCNNCVHILGNTQILGGQIK